MKPKVTSHRRPAEKTWMEINNPSEEDRARLAEIDARHERSVKAVQEYNRKNSAKQFEDGYGWMEALEHSKREAWRLVLEGVDPAFSHLIPNEEHWHAFTDWLESRDEYGGRRIDHYDETAWRYDKLSAYLKADTPWESSNAE